MAEKPDKEFVFEWFVDDGYINNGRTQYTVLSPHEVSPDSTVDDVVDEIESAIQETFAERVTASYSTADVRAMAERLLAAAKNLEASDGGK